MNRHFRKILLFILTTGLLPVVICFVVIEGILRLYEENNFSLHTSAVAAQKIQCEEAMKYLEKSVIQVLSSNDELSLSVYTPLLPQKYQTFNHSMSYLARIQSYDLMVRDAVLVSWKEQWAINFDQIQPLATSQYKELSFHFQQTARSSFWEYRSDSGLVYLVKKLPLNISQGGDGVLFVCIPSDMFDALLVVEENDQLYPMVVLDENGQRIVGTYQNQIILDTAKTNLKCWSTLLKKGSATLTYNQQTYIITRLASDYNQWIYYSVTPASELYNTFGLARAICVGIGIAVLALIGGFTIVFSQQLYQPYLHLHRRLGQVEPDGTEPSEDLDRRIDQVLSQYSHMSNDLQTHRQLRRQKTLSEIFSGSYPYPSQDDLLSFGIIEKPIDGAQMCVAAVQMQDTIEDPGERELWQYGIQNIVSEIVSSHNCLPPCSVNSILYFVQYQFNLSITDAARQTEALCQSIIFLVEKYLHLHLCIGVSGYFSAFSQVTIARGECHLALRQCLQNQQAISFYEPSVNTISEECHIAFSQNQQRILEALENADVDACSAALEDYFAQVGQANFYWFKLELNQLLYQLTTFGSRHAVALDLSKCQPVFDFDVMAPLNTLEQLKNYLMTEYLIPICQAGSLSSTQAEKDLVRKMAQFSIEQAEGDSSLEQCAKSLHYSAGYLSRIFKFQTGRNYQDYATQIKMERCQKLLIQTQDSIAEISQRLGYARPQNLIRAFKKYTSVTPGQYRENWQREHSPEQHE